MGKTEHQHLHVKHGVFLLYWALQSESEQRSMAHATTQKRMKLNCVFMQRKVQTVLWWWCRLCVRLLVIQKCLRDKSRFHISDARSFSWRRRQNLTWPRVTQCENHLRLLPLCLLQTNCMKSLGIGKWEPTRRVLCCLKLKKYYLFRILRFIQFAHMCASAFFCISSKRTEHLAFMQLKTAFEESRANLKGELNGPWVCALQQQMEENVQQKVSWPTKHGGEKTAWCSEIKLCSFEKMQSPNTSMWNLIWKRNKMFRLPGGHVSVSVCFFDPLPWTEGQPYVSTQNSTLAFKSELSVMNQLSLVSSVFTNGPKVCMHKNSIHFSFIWHQP